jgi:hypothetical protein
LGRRDPPITPIDLPPPVFLAASKPAAATERASAQLTSTSSSPRRTMGAAIRFGLEEEAKAKRPLSHNQPQLTGSESTPIKRVNSPELDCSATRQPTEHVVHVLST